jgi:hypothetical protein
VNLPEKVQGLGDNDSLRRQPVSRRILEVNDTASQDGTSGHGRLLMPELFSKATSSLLIRGIAFEDGLNFGKMYTVYADQYHEPIDSAPVGVVGYFRKKALIAGRTFKRIDFQIAVGMGMIEVRILTPIYIMFKSR